MWKRAPVIFEDLHHGEMWVLVLWKDGYLALLSLYRLPALFSRPVRL
jgi:hypothetical protein